ncbi:MAG: uroporphyrinogen decarboxylase [Alphaproteobacteria bacterium]
MKSTSSQKSLFLRTLDGQSNDRSTEKRSPAWMMRQAGRYLPEYRAVRKEAGSFLDLCLNPETAIEVTLQPIRRFGFDAAILFSDILIVPLGLGQDLKFVEGRGPVLEALSKGDVLPTFDPIAFDAKVGAVYQTVSGLRTELDADKTTLIGFAGAPWTVATYMVEGGSSKDFAKTKDWAFCQPDTFGKLMDVLVESTIHYLNQQAAAGAEVLKLFDTWAGALSPNQRELWSRKPIERIIAGVRKTNPDIPFIVFARGVGPALTDYDGMSEGLALDTSLAPEWARENLTKANALQGNLDPIALVAGGAALDAEVDRILTAMDGRAHVINLGHGIIPQTPISHVEQFVKRIGL